MNKSVIVGAVLLVVIIILAGCEGKSIEADNHGNTEDTIGPESLSEGMEDKKILDVRTNAEYAQGHINGALVLSLDKISESKLSTLDFGKEDDIIVYANSDILAKRAKKFLDALGYEHVKTLNGGLVHWEEDGFDVVSGKMDIEFTEQEIQKTSALIIGPLEYDFGIIDRKSGIVSTQFSIKNSGEKEVKIEEISTSCGCTSAEISKEEIFPEESVNMEVFFDPDFHKEPMGRFSRTVFLQTSEGIELQAKIWVEIKELGE